MNKQIFLLDEDTFLNIYTSKKFRNEVAYSHGYTSKNGEKGLLTCSYPIQYIVSEDQKKAALAEIDKDKNNILNNIKDNTIIFIGMGASYEARFEDDICNHRIRAEFANNTNRYFIELCRGLGENMHITYSIDRSLEKFHHDKLEELHKSINKYGWNNAPKNLLDQRDKYMKQPYNNYAGLELTNVGLKYTLNNALNLINKYFDCNFKEAIIDEYTLSPDDFISKSII